MTAAEMHERRQPWDALVKRRGSGTCAWICLNDSQTCVTHHAIKFVKLCHGALSELMSRWRFAIVSSGLAMSTAALPGNIQYLSRNIQHPYTWG